MNKPTGLRLSAHCLTSIYTKVFMPPKYFHLSYFHLICSLWTSFYTKPRRWWYNSTWTIITICSVVDLTFKWMEIRDLCLVALSVLIAHNIYAHFKVRDWTAITLEEVRLLQTWQRSAVDLCIITEGGWMGMLLGWLYSFLRLSAINWHFGRSVITNFIIYKYTSILQIHTTIVYFYLV